MPSFKYHLGAFVSTKMGTEGFINGRFRDGDTVTYQIRTKTDSVECQEKDCYVVKHKPVECK